jgi:hypothetical protein
LSAADQDHDDAPIAVVADEPRRTTRTPAAAATAPVAAAPDPGDDLAGSAWEALVADAVRDDAEDQAWEQELAVGPLPDANDDGRSDARPREPEIDRLAAASDLHSMDAGHAGADAADHVTPQPDLAADDVPPIVAPLSTPAAAAADSIVGIPLGAATDSTELPVIVPQPTPAPKPPVLQSNLLANHPTAGAAGDVEVDEPLPSIPLATDDDDGAPPISEPPAEPTTAVADDRHAANGDAAAERLDLIVATLSHDVAELESAWSEVKRGGEGSDL